MKDTTKTILAVISLPIIIAMIVTIFCWMGRIKFNEDDKGLEKEVAWTELNLRDEAGTENTNVLTTLGKGDVVCLTGRFRDTNIGGEKEYCWVEITYGDITGWVRYDGLARG